MRSGAGRSGWLAAAIGLVVLPALMAAIGSASLAARRPAPPTLRQAPPAVIDKDAPPDPTVDTSIVMFPGGIIWQTTLSSPPAFAPAFDGDRAFAVLQNDTIVALSVVTGAVLWTAVDAATQPPAAGANNVAGVRGREVWVRDAASGESRWRRDIDQKPVLAPVVAERGVIVATERGDILCLRIADGAPAWRVALGSTPTALASDPGGLVLAGFADGRVVALSTATGASTWTRALKGRVLALNAVENRVFAGSDNNFLYVLDARKGGQKWKWRTGGDVASAVAVQAKRLSYASLDSMLRMHNRRNGDLVWKRPMPSRPVGHPVFLDDRVVQGDVAFDLRAYRIQDGSPVGSYSLPDRLIHTPHFAPEVPGVPARLVVLTAQGDFMALGRGVDGAVVSLVDLPGTELLAEQPIDWVMDPPVDPLLRIMAALLPLDVLFPLDLRFSDPPLVPLSAIPGISAPPEVLMPLRLRLTDPPLVPMLVLPGRPVPREELPVRAARAG